jgi:hypothetical protein
MRKHSVMTATSQGIVSYDAKNVAHLEKYGKLYQNKNHVRTKKVQKTIAEVEKIHLDMIQRAMYRRLMYGLKEYTPEQVASMSPSSISRIVEDFKKAKRALHVLKAKQYYAPETKIINAILKAEGAEMELIGERDYDWYIELPKTVTLRSLGIGTKQVIEEFIKRKLLPKNFWSINVENVPL